MVDVVFVAVGRPALWPHLPRRKRAGFRTVFGVEGAKHIVVAAVLLNKEDDVIDFLDAHGRAWSLPQHRGDEHSPNCEQEKMNGKSCQSLNPHGTHPDRKKNMEADEWKVPALFFRNLPTFPEFNAPADNGRRSPTVNLIVPDHLRGVPANIVDLTCDHGQARSRRNPAMHDTRHGSSCRNILRGKVFNPAMSASKRSIDSGRRFLCPCACLVDSSPT